MDKYIGFDMGATKLLSGVVDAETGKILGSQAAPTLAHEGKDAVIDRMANLIEKAIGKSGVPKSAIVGIGIGVPGVLSFCSTCREIGRRCPWGILFPANWNFQPIC